MLLTPRIKGGCGDAPGLYQHLAILGKRPQPFDHRFEAFFARLAKTCYTIYTFRTHEESGRFLPLFLLYGLAVPRRGLSQ